ncbi:MAG: exopolysaccharide biosynthesis protein [Aureliella sp.]
MRYQTYESPVTLLDILSSIFRYKWRAAFVTLLMFAIVVASIVLYPKRYQSEAKLFVRLGRGSASLDPAAIGQTISIQESRETEMNSITDLLQSRALAENIVAEVGPERLLKKYAWIERTLESTIDRVSEAAGPLLGSDEEIPELTIVEDSDPPSPSDSAEPLSVPERKRFELAVKEVQSNLKVDSPKRSTTISIAFRARQPELAQDVVRSAIKQYRDMHIAAYQSQGSLEFFDQQFSQQEEIVKQSEDSLRKTKTENDIVTVRGKQDQLQSEITDVKKMQLETRADLQATLARVVELEGNIKLLKGEVVSERTSGIASGASDAMRNRLYELEIREKELASKYVSTDPRLQRVREQLREAREIVSQQPNEREQSVLAINPVRQQVENDLLAARAAVAGLEAKQDALVKLEAELLTQLEGINQLEVDSEEMERKILVARENYLSYAKKLEESRINAALDENALSNVSVVGKPTLQFKHVSPKRSILAAVGACFSVLCGAAVALISDYGRNARELSVIRRAERDAYLRRLQSARDIIEQPLALEPKDSRRLVSSSGAEVGADDDSAEASSSADSSNGNTEDASDDDTPKKAK